MGDAHPQGMKKDLKFNTASALWGMKHYVYRLTCPEGFYYIGCRSAVDPATDDYTGSGTRIRHCIDVLGWEFEKEIVAVFDSREEASTLESALVDNLDPWSLNLHPGGIEPRKRRAAAGNEGSKNKPRT